jgi:hypothetical protein
MGRGFILFVGGLLVFLAAFSAKHVLIAPPAVPAQAAPGEFDANRAFARLERVLAGEPPHPVDSPGSDIVRERLLAEMRAVGLQPRVTDSMSCNGFPAAGSVHCARVRNLAATIGPAHGEHLLIVAHYDSVPVGPGAADDGIGVAAMLEVAEQLRGRQLTRPITFLFNEGEENGLLGARAFLEQDPAAARVSHLVNLEARGTEGPAIMFETSRPNAAAINLYDQAVERPLANSLSTDFYRLLPNSTDVAVFEERPWTILNIAIIGNEARYHTAGDSLAALDRRSLQHMGTQTLQLATTYATGDVPGGSSELIYADVLSRHLIDLPLIAGLVLLGLIVLLYGYAVIRRRALGWPLLASGAALAGAALFAWLATSVMQAIRPGEYWRAYPLANHLALAATALLAALLALALSRGAARDRLRAAFWFLYTLAGVAICAVAPGAAIYFLLAPAILLGGILIERWRPGAERVAAWMAAAVQILTLFPLIALMEQLLSTSPGWVAAPLIAAAALPLLIELQPEAGTGRAGRFAMLGLTAATWIAVFFAPAYSEDRQRIFTIEHVRNEASGEAKWGIYDDGGPLPQAYEQLGQWSRGPVDYARRERWIAPAPAVAGPTPRLVKVGERPAGENRLVTVRAEMNGWDRFDLQIPAAARARQAGVNGRAHAFDDGSGDGRATFRCAGRSCDGLTFDLLIGAEPVDATLVGSVARLPDAAAPLVRSRPHNARPQYVPDASYVLAPVRL